MSNNTDLEKLIDAAKEDLANTKAAYDAAKKANDDSYTIAESAQSDFKNQSNKLDSLRLHAVQMRADGEIDIANQLDKQIELETIVYDQLAAVSQEKWHESQLAASAIYDPEEQYNAAKKNLETLQDLKKTSDNANIETPIETSDTSTNNNTSNSTGVNPGDRVQIKVGAIDITNGNAASAGQLYVQGGPIWATVESVEYNWNTGGRWNLPESVTKVRCKGADGQTIVWQVTPDDISSNIIRSNKPTQKISTPLPVTVPTTDAGMVALNVAESEEVSTVKSTVSVQGYTTVTKSQSWAVGVTTSANPQKSLPSTAAIKTQVNSGSSMDKSRF